MGSAHEGFDPMPSRERLPDVSVAERGGARTAVTGVPVGSHGEVPPELGLGWPELTDAGFEGKAGQTLVVPVAGGPPMVAVGVGEADKLDAAGVRDAAAAFATAAKTQGTLATALADVPGVPADEAAQAVVEGVLLARYAYTPLKAESSGPAVSSLSLTVSGDRVSAAQSGARCGLSYAAAGLLARDLANSPPSMLNAERMADVAKELGDKAGLRVEVFDRKALQKLGCGGLLGVNAGSVDEPRMIKLSYRPKGHAPHLTLVGKGIMYDSGGISLKPADAVHATMKNDMSGAGAILAAMAVLPELDCPTAVTGYLMCTDNMPSGTATKLGDVLRIRGGTTVEVINADAEGRLVMADALVLATEERTDAIVDIATLTGACLRALGAQVAGVFGNDQSLVDQMLTAAEKTDEPAWQLPLEHRYRSEMDSDVADLKNIGTSANGMAIHAALFLEEFVDGKPWAHLDIAGPAQCDAPSGWRTKGCTGFGARLLLDLAMHFTAPAAVS